MAGLIFAFYNPEYRIISPDIGGQFKSKFSLGPRFLHATFLTEKFLKDLGMSAEVKEVKVGYFNDGYIKPNDKFRKKYFEKSRGKSGIFDDTSMNNNKSRFLAYDVDFRKIIGLLNAKLKDRVVKDRIAEINFSEQKLVGDKKVYDYDKLVSTIPKNIFCRLAGTERNLQSKDITYVLINKNFFNMRDYDFVYVADEYKIYHRLTMTADGIVADVLGARTKAELENEFRGVLIDFKILRGAQLMPASFEIHYPNVEFVGRYGRWDRNWKIETVIEHAIKNRRKDG